MLKYFCGNVQQDLTITSTNNSLRVQFHSDNVIQSSGFLATWKQITKPETVPEKFKPSYMFSFPLGFSTVNSDATEENVCLQLFNVKDAGQTEILAFKSENILQNEPSFTKTIPYDPASNSSMNCFSLQLPEEFSKNTAAIIAIKGKFGEYDFLSYKVVRVVKSSTLSMIQTDMYDYRPGQEVQVRLLVLDGGLKPSRKVRKVDEVYINDPSDNRLAQWKNVELRNGLAQFKIKLDDEPDLGKYVIKAKVKKGNETELLDRKEFTVSERVLPQFEVIIKGTKSMMIDSIKEKFEVCGLYTHGGKVKGKAFVKFHSDALPLDSVMKNQTTEGCVTFTLNATEIAKMVKPRVKKLKLFAEVEETKTGRMENASFVTEIKLQPFKLTFEGSNKGHTVVKDGGFPFVGSLKAISHDGLTPIASTTIQLCSRLYTDIDEFRSRFSDLSYNFWYLKEEQIYKMALNLAKIKAAEKCENVTTKADGSIDFSVNLHGIAENVTKLSIQATAVNHPANETSGIKQPVETFEVVLSHSNATSAITVKDKTLGKLGCMENEIPVYFSVKPATKLYLYWYFTSSGTIIDQGEETINAGNDDSFKDYVGDAKDIDFSTSSQPLNLSKYNLKLKLPLENGNQDKVSNKIKLLVFTREAENGTILTNRKEYEVESCEKSQKLSWGKAKIRPGENVDLKIENGPSQALCGLTVVDKSVRLVKNPNRVTKVRLQELKEELAKKKNVEADISHKCQDAKLVFKAFESLGLFVLSDQLLEDSDCDYLIEVDPNALDKENFVPTYAEISADSANFDYDVDLRGPPAQAVQAAAPLRPMVEFAREPAPLAAGLASFAPKERIEENKVELRNYFPETWLFDLVDLDENGNIIIEEEAPHSITTWIGESICLSPQTGLTVSNEADLLVSQDFFADLILPYSVKRGEIFPLNASVFSTVDQTLPVKLTVMKSGAFKTAQPETDICLAPQDNDIRTFTATAKKLGTVNITLEAKLTSNPDCELADKNAEGFTDSLVKSIEVKPEGFPVEKTQSEFICRKDNEEASILDMEPLGLPDDLVDDSERAFIAITGDIMAPALSNLQKLVKVPFGCGEQNMISVVPNIYLLKYLQGKGVSVPSVEEKAKKYMKIGWERQQKFRHPDGAYSVWGPTDEEAEGSIWLTSFVVKAFAQASQFIEIDHEDLDKSVSWILSQQNKTNGCFNDVGYVIHSELKGPSTTASILTSLLEVKDKFEKFELEGTIDKALGCIFEKDSDDLYTM